MSLIALIATSVSAYAVSSTNFASARVRARGLEELDAGHPRHPLIRGDERHRPVAERELAQHREGLGAGRGAHDLVLGAVLAAQVAGDRLRHRRIVVDRQNRGLHHPAVLPVTWSRRRLPPVLGR